MPALSKMLKRKQLDDDDECPSKNDPIIAYTTDDMDTDEEEHLTQVSKKAKQEKEIERRVQYDCYIKNRQFLFTQFDEMFLNMRTKISDQMNHIDNLEEIVNKKDRASSSTQTTIDNMKAQIDKLSQQKMNLKTEMTRILGALENASGDLSKADARIKEKDKVIADLQKLSNEQQTDLLKFESRIKEQHTNLIKSESVIKQQQFEIEKLKSMDVFDHKLTKEHSLYIPETQVDDTEDQLNSI